MRMTLTTVARMLSALPSWWRGVPSVALLVLAQAVSASTGPVPIEEEPRHRLDFGNQLVRVFQIDIEPGGATLFHVHVNDGVGVRLSDARVRDQVLDGGAEDVAVARGTVSFSHRPQPLTHRVTNIGTTPFLNTFVEILPAAQPPSAPLPDLAAGWTLVLQNERVRVSRRALAPRGSADMQAHGRGGLRVALSSGTVEIESTGSEASTETLDPGEARWQDPGTRSSWRNAGETVVEVVAIELR